MPNTEKEKQDFEALLAQLKEALNKAYVKAYQDDDELKHEKEAAANAIYQLRHQQARVLFADASGKGAAEHKRLFLDGVMETIKLLDSLHTLRKQIIENTKAEIESIYSGPLYEVEGKTYPYHPHQEGLLDPEGFREEVHQFHDSVSQTIHEAISHKVIGCPIETETESLELKRLANEDLTKLRTMIEEVKAAYTRLNEGNIKKLASRRKEIERQIKNTIWDRSGYRLLKLGIALALAGVAMSFFPRTLPWATIVTPVGFALALVLAPLFLIIGGNRRAKQLRLFANHHDLDSDLARLQGMAEYELGVVRDRHYMGLARPAAPANEASPSRTRPKKQA